MRGDRELPCNLTGCNNPVKARGLCGSHYRRLMTYGDPDAGAPQRGKAADVFEEIDWFLQAGVHPALIADVLHSSAVAVAQLCRRHGRVEWARQFENAA